MLTLCVVSCGKRKIWDVDPNAPPEVEARFAYVGPLAKLAMEYAEKFHRGHWVILSAKYGFIFPWEKIRKYDVTFPYKVSDTVITWLRHQAEEKSLTKYGKIIVIASRRYADIVKKVFRDKVVVAPLEGLSIFQILKKLRMAIQSGVPLA